MTLSLLESRLKHSLPKEHHEEVEREVAQYQSEIQRLSSRREDIGQATLTNQELRLAPTANQHSEKGFTTIELQCIKAAAIKYQVDDWIHKIDSTLSYEENISLMKNRGEERNMKQLEEIR
jgi:hypothetical protein